MSNNTTFQPKLCLPGRNSKYHSTECEIPINAFPNKGEEITIPIYPMAVQLCAHDLKKKCFNECSMD